MAVFTCSSIVGTDMYKTTAKQNKNEPGIHADLENRETHEMKSCIIIIMSKRVKIQQVILGSIFLSYLNTYTGSFDSSTGCLPQKFSY